MLIKKHTEIVIENTPEKVWDYANDPKNWTASNPEEHRGLKFFNPKNRPETGTEFYQKEYVAGIYADLRGQILYADRPYVCVWTGAAKYKVLGGLIKPRIPLSGLMKIERQKDGSRLTHDVSIDFPDTIFGKLMLWFFKNILDGDEAVRDHTYKELVFFKDKLESEE